MSAWVVLLGQKICNFVCSFPTSSLARLFVFYRVDWLASDISLKQDTSVSFAIRR